MNNITLIGMPGAGKSTIGVVLAKVLGYQFLDSDLLIQKQEKRRLSEIIEEEGYKGFKDVENRVNASIEAENTVIAIGWKRCLLRRSHGTSEIHRNRCVFEIVFKCSFKATRKSEGQRRFAERRTESYGSV